jgi:hypothetical protein
MVLYIVMMIPVFLLGLYAQYKVKSNFAKYSKVQAGSRMTGAEAAARMLAAEGLSGVEITLSNGGQLSDHYDPNGKVIRLSPEVYNGRSVAALGVACHEAGHALQDRERYAPLVIRNLAVPTANFGSTAGFVIILIGMAINMTGLAIIGLILFSLTAVFQIINLPVEFDASARAKHALISHGLVNPGAEENGVSKVLNAAALTYVAGTLASIMSVLYYAFIIFANRR